uniref:Uncharacterized protein n=1 Tax=Rhizophora mucronata TaxID=61149 RepID=A0A2P2P7H9_RHIMU
MGESNLAFKCLFKLVQLPSVEFSGKVL